MNTHETARPPTTRNRLVAPFARFATLTLFGLLFIAMALAEPAAAQETQQAEGRPRVLATTVATTITPVIADHLRSGISRAEDDGYDAFLIRLDTPGGLDTSMRSIIKDILASEVPVVVYISPSGARGASAGAIIGFSAHVVAMAPGTSIGAATPIAGGDGSDLEDKVVNEATAYAESLAELRDRDIEFIGDTVREGRSASANEALELGAIDIVAGSDIELLEAIDGMTVVVGTDPAPLDDIEEEPIEIDDPDRARVTGQEVEINTSGAVIDEHEMGFLRTIQQYLADPNLAFILLSIGTLGLIYELASPGLGVGAALGTAFIVLALFGLAVLPVDIVGVLFLLLALALFAAEVFAPGIGLAAAGGAFFLVLSGIFLFDEAPGLELSMMVVVPTAVVLALFVVIAGRFAVRARRAPSTTTGPGLFVGKQAELRVHGGLPQLFIAGAWWSVTSRDPTMTFADGQVVDIVDVDGLNLVVEPHADDQASSTGTAGG